MFNGKEWESVPEAKNLIFYLLQFDPHERYDAYEALNHKFFNSVLTRDSEGKVNEAYSTNRDPKVLHSL